MLFLSVNKLSYTMKKLFLTLLAFASLAICACKETEEQIVPEIKVPAESAQVFASGIQFEATADEAAQPQPSQPSQPEVQTSQLQFTATDKWTAEVTDTKASSWLSVEPTSGNAGDVTMTVTAQPNTTPDPRSATVTIKCGDVTKSFTVSQEGAKPTVIEVESISLDKTGITLTEGDEFTLTATVKPDNATDKAVSWASSNNNVASVEGGKVTAIAEGSATITATAGDKTATCEVTVNKQYIVVESVSLSETALSLIKGATATLTATVSPADATNPAVSWTSSDESVASVKDGVVTAIKSGTATITATAENATATCAVTVSNPATSLSLDQRELALYEGESATLVATVEPADADDLPVAWTSADPEIATVDANGKVTAIAQGTVRITATCGNFWASCQVTVNPKVIPVEDITLDKTTLELTKGAEATLTANVLPNTATDKTVTWSTSDASVATVNDGVVKAIKSGTATITASVGRKSATCAVTVTTPVTRLALDKNELALTEGETAQLTPTVEPEDADDKTVAWKSSNTNVATVDAEGKVTAVSEGEAVITATCGNFWANCRVTVSKKIIPVDAITLDKTTLDLITGATATLTATVSPDNATDKTVSWTSSNTNVAAVDANGKITAIATGETTITATTVDGLKRATCAVTVTNPATKITLDRFELYLNPGQTLAVIANVEPADADEPVVWTSKNTNIATVDANGNVTGVDNGVTEVIATCGNVSASCNIIVLPPIIDVEYVTLSETQKSLVVGEDFFLEATLHPQNASFGIRWTTSDASVATVDENGKVTAVAEGTTTITATSEGKSATCTVTVTAAVVHVTSVTLNESQKTLSVSETFQLRATVMPDNATDKSVTWSSSNPSVATVAEKDAFGGNGSVIEAGLVTAKGEGEAIITASCDGKSATCKIIVTKPVIPVTSITLDKPEVSICIGESETLTATVNPDNATDKTVTWTSSNTNVATVDANGKITAKATGETTITASAGGKSVTCKVTVTKSALEDIIDDGVEEDW